jgi:hypothetical protein
MNALVGDKVIAVISVDEGKNPPPQLLSRRAVRRAVKRAAAIPPNRITHCMLAVLILL